MPRIRRVEDLSAPELEPYRTLRRAEEHRRRGIFVAEGEKVARRLLRSALEPLSLLATDAWLDRLSEEELRRLPEIWVAAPAALRTIVGYPFHQGIMAVGRVPAAPRLEALGAASGPRLLCALDGLSGPDNVGTVVRNCAAFAVDALLVGPTSSSPWLRRAVRSSMGAVFALPVVEVEDLPAALAALAARGITAIAAETGGEPLFGCALPPAVCVVLGGEGGGLSAAVERACARRVSVPTAPAVESLNVASAAAVLLAELRRRQGWRPQAARR